MNIINEEILDSDELFNVNISKLQEKKIIYFYKLNRFKNRFKKIIKFRLNQVKKLI